MAFPQVQYKYNNILENGRVAFFRNLTQTAFPWSNSNDSDSNHDSLIEGVIIPKS